MIDIASATEQDVEGMADLLLSLFDQEADFVPDRAKQLAGLGLILAEPKTGQLFVARMGGRIVGMVSLLFTVSTALGKPVCWLEDMVVSKEARGQGLGSKLLNHALAFAKEQGFGRVTLLTDLANKDGQRFYARHGFSHSEMTPMRILL